VTPVAAFLCATVAEKPLDRDFLRTLLFQARFGRDEKEPKQKTNKNQSRDKQKNTGISSRSSGTHFLIIVITSLNSVTSKRSTVVCCRRSGNRLIHTGQ